MTPSYNYNAVPYAHPFRKFLDDLPYDSACDPHPDFIEAGSTRRYMAAFNSINGNARLSYFARLIRAKSPRDPVVTIMSQHSGEKSAQATLYLDMFDLYLKDRHSPTQTVMALMPAPALTNKPMEGILQMPTY